MPEQPQRQVLPIPDRQHVGVTTYDAKDPDTAFPPIEPCQTPSFERLADNGLRYNRLKVAMARQ